MKNKTMITIASLLVVFVLGVISFYYFSSGDLSTIGTNSGLEGEFETPFQCSVADTCVSSIISSGSGTQEELDEIMQYYDFECREGMCVGTLQ